MDDLFDFSTGESRPAVTSGAGEATSSGGSSSGFARAASTASTSTTGAGAGSGSQPNNSMEVQRLLVENRKLRQENTALKVQIQEYKVQLGNTSGRGPLQRKEDSHKEQVIDDNSEDDEHSSQGQQSAKSSKRKNKSGDHQSESSSTSQNHRRIVANLKAEIERLQQSNTKLNQAFGDYTLVNTEREYAYASVFASVREELDAVKAERDGLQKALDVERQKTAAMEAQIRNPPSSSASSNTVATSTSSAAATVAVVSDVLQTVGRELQQSLQRAAMAALSHAPLTNAGGRRLSASERQAMLRKLSGSLALPAAKRRRQQPAEDTAESFFFEEEEEEENDGVEDDHAQEMHPTQDTIVEQLGLSAEAAAALTDESFAPDPTKGVGDADMSSAFRQVQLRNQVLVASRALNLPKGAGALRSAAAGADMASAAGSGVAGKKRTRSVKSATSVQKSGGGTAAPTTTTRTAATRSKRRGALPSSSASSLQRGHGRAEDGTSDTASATGSINPFEGVKMTNVVTASSSAARAARDHKVLIADDAVGGISGGLGRSSSSPFSSSFTVEEYLNRASQIPPPTKMSLAKLYIQLIKKYHQDFTLIAEEVKQYILKQCHSAVMSGELPTEWSSPSCRNTTTTTATMTTTTTSAIPSSAEVEPEQATHGEPPSSPMGYWTRDWQATARATEGLIWRTLQKLFAGFEVHQLFPALQACFTTAVMMLLERCAEHKAEEQTQGPSDGMRGMEQQQQQQQEEEEEEAHRRGAAVATAADTNEVSPVDSSALAGPSRRRHKVSSAVVQLHTLTTALNFLWLQYLLDLYHQHKATEPSAQEATVAASADGSSGDGTSGSDFLVCLSTVPRMKDAVVDIRRRATQLLHDGSIAALRQWHSSAAADRADQAASSATLFLSRADEEVPRRSTTTTATGDAKEGDEQERVDHHHHHHHHGGHLAKSGDLRLPPPPPRDGPRATVLRLWMTMVQALVGRTAERRGTLELTECPLAVYDKLLLHNLVSPAPPKGGLMTLVTTSGETRRETKDVKQSSSSIMNTNTNTNNNVSVRSSSSGGAAATAAPATSSEGGFGHALMVYMLKSIMAGCLNSLAVVAAPPPPSSASSSSVAAGASGSIASAITTTTTTTIAIEPTETTSALAAIRDIWFHVTDAVGWSVGVRTVEEMADIALTRLVAMDQPEDDRTHPTAAAHSSKSARGNDTGNEESGRDDDDDDEESQQDSDSDSDSEDEDEALEGEGRQKSQKKKRQSTSASSTSPIVRLPPGMAHLVWEKKSSTPLLALRLAVLHKGFPFIASFIQPRAHGKPHEDDIMAHVLSSVVLDLRFVAASAGIDGREDAEAEVGDASLVSAAAAVRPGESGGDGGEGAPQSGGGGGPDVSRRVLKFLLEYVTDPSMRPPFPMAGTIHIMAIEGIVQLLSHASPQDIQRHTAPLVAWMQQGARTVAMKSGLSVSEKVKPRLLGLLGKDSCWQSTTGRSILEKFISDDI